MIIVNHFTKTVRDIAPTASCEIPIEDVDLSLGEPENTGGYLVSTAGYIPKEIQLQRLATAGANLDSYLKRTYNNGNALNYVPHGFVGDEEPEENITARKDFDVFDAYRELGIVRDRLLSQREEELRRMHPTFVPEGVTGESSPAIANEEEVV